MQDFIITYTKVKFYPLNPKKEDIKIEDIAHALSLMTRANGHCRYFYSVAQHSLNCYLEAKARGCSKRVQLGCLLHDASESYISDLTRPVKRNMPEYVAIEAKLQDMIYDRFGLGDLSEEELRQIDEIDDTLLYYEFEALMDYPIFEQKPAKAATYTFRFEDHFEVEKQYISAFGKITGTKNITQVTAAILRQDGKILICRRDEGGSCPLLWEFPGGKQEEGEDLVQCLVRECQEELGVKIEVDSVFAETDYIYGDKEMHFTFFNSRIKEGTLRKTVHREIRWVKPEELEQYTFCPADVEVAEKLSSVSGSSSVSSRQRPAD